MKPILLLFLLALCGCAHTERPYVKETMIGTDGRPYMTREYSADWVKGRLLIPTKTQ